jgi:hypothetical protein
MLFVDGSNDRVGIGTASPTYTLDVAGDIGVNEYIYHNDDSNTYMRFTPDTWLVRTGGDDRIIVDSSGNVGIRTTPDTGWNSNFDVLQIGTAGVLYGYHANAQEVMCVGTNFNQVGASFVTADRINEGYAQQYLQDHTGQHVFRTAVSAAANSSVSWIDAMIIDNAGKVGIGNTSPDSKLDVVSGASRNTGGTARFGKVADHGLFLHSDASSSSYNWIITTQDTVNKGFEIIPSTAAGGTTFTTPALVIIADTGNVHLNTGVDVRVQLGTSGTGATSVSDNSVYVRGNDDDLILGAAGNGNISFKENADTRMFIKTGGGVGIGTTNPLGAGLYLAGTDTATYDGTSADQLGASTLVIKNSQYATLNNFSQIAMIVSGGSGGSSARIVAIEPGQAQSDLAFVLRDGSYHGEKMRIKGLGGRVGIGTADPGSSKLKVVENAATTFSGSFVNSHASGYGMGLTHASGYQIFFYDGSGYTGAIQSNNSGTTTYATTSDYRLKENIVDMTGAITRLKQLKPKRFNWIADETNTVQDGFLAHEAQAVVPISVTGTKDDNFMVDGEQIYQSMDSSLLVPLLVGALQEALDKIDAQEARIAALEA